MKRAVGANLQRVDGPDKVRGRALFPQDLPADGCLHAATVRATLPHALIREIDARSALAVPDVLRVLTASDVRGSNRYGLLEDDQEVLASTRVRGTADVVALVVAATEHAAPEGARRVRLALEPLPIVAAPEHACDPGAPALHPERAVRGSHPNVVSEARIVRGDAVAALAGAAVVIDGEYRTGHVEHAFLAPEAGMAAPNARGGLTLWTATQWPEEDLRQAARALGEPLERLRLVQTAIGGAFGGREDVSLQILLLLAARELGAPVRMVWDRAESLRGHGKRHPFRLRYRLGADRAGRLLALHAELLADAGGYAGSSGAVLANAMAHAAGPYVIDHVLVEGRAVYTNNPFTCAFRGFGANQVTFALEQQLNKLAARLGLDPVELRRRNVAMPGSRLGTGQHVVAPHGLLQCIARVEECSAARALPADADPWRHGRGFACTFKNVGYSFGFDDHATAQVTLTREGAVVHTGAAEVGQGVETVLTQIAAEALALAPERVRIVWQDTAAAPEASSSSASHQTFVSGNAVRLACLRARRAADDLGGATSLTTEGVTVVETYHAPRTSMTPEEGMSHYADTWSACTADVAVDLETGRVRVLRVVDAVDAGRVINPQLFSAQVEGGVVMGQGYALQERYAVRDAVPLTTGLGECTIPTAVDAVPEIEVIAVEVPDPNGPFGARGIGEVTMLPVVPAITAAIHAATGVWVDQLPATPERVLAGLDQLAAHARESSATDGGA